MNFGSLVLGSTVNYRTVSIKCNLYEVVPMKIVIVYYFHQYFNFSQDGSEGSLETLVTIYADKFYTYEDDVLTALRSLRHRQVEKEGTFEDPPSQV